MGRWLAVLIVPLLFGCVSFDSFDGFRMSREVRQSGTFFVEHQPNDSRRIDHVIRGALRSHGLEMSTSAEESHNYTVSYIDNWAWDMRTYMIDFRVDVRDAKTNVLVGTARSFQTSLSAMGHSYQEIVRKTIRALFYGAKASEPRKRRQSRRR